MTKTITIDVEEESYNRGYEDGCNNNDRSVLSFIIGFVVCLCVIFFLKIGNSLIGYEESTQKANVAYNIDSNRVSPLLRDPKYYYKFYK